MILTSVMSMLALRSVVDGAVAAIEQRTGVPLRDKVDPAFVYIDATIAIQEFAE